MAKPADCNQNSDPLKLIRDGANQEQRLSPALDPAYANINEHTIAHGMIFAQSLSQFLRYFDSTNTANGSWAPFFSSDPSLRLALAGIQNIEEYKTQIKSYFDFLNNLDNELKETELINNLSYIFSCLASLAKQLDVLKEGLSSEFPLKSTLQNLIQSQLAVAFNRLISYHKAGVSTSMVADVAPVTSIKILGVLPEKYQAVLDSGFSKDWITNGATDWNTYVAGIPADPGAFGNPAGSIFDRTNHIATHNLFTSIADQFLKVFARVIIEANQALEFTFTNWNKHEPHYALFLSFLRLMEYSRTEANTITARHLDFYYREVLQLKEKPALPVKAHLVVELAKQAASYQFKTADLFKAGKDDKGSEAYFANKRDFVANQAKISSLKTVYRHGSEDVGTDQNSKKQIGRLYASPIADSDDGTGAELTSADYSWHPFFNKKYSGGKLQSIQMPAAEIGFALVSHYFWLEEGKRDITIDFTVNGFDGNVGEEKSEDFVCLFTGEEGWIEKSPAGFAATSGNNLRLTVSLTGDDPAIVAYDAKKHGYNFDSIAPVLIVKMRNDADKQFVFSQFEKSVLKKIQIQVSVDQVKNLTLSNDFGSIDASKPFLPFGAIPEAGSSLIIGSNEIFRKKNIENCRLTIRWKNIPDIKSVAYLAWEQYYPSASYDYYTKFVPWANVTFLKEGQWSGITYQTLFDGDNEVKINLKPPAGEFNKNDQPGFNTDSQFTIKAKTGFARLALPYGMGHKTYRSALSDYILAVAKGTTATKPTEPYTPEIESVTAEYTAIQTINPGTAQEAGFENRSARFLHISPFGFAEQHAFLKLNAPDSPIYLFPQFRHLNISDNLLPEGQPVLHESEFYIGVSDLKPPQNLALFFQVADGTADPLSKKPPKHINWSYLRNNEWIEFFLNEVEDQTEGLLKSGLITFAIPRDATDANSLLAPGQHWIRAAVSADSDAVCRLKHVSAQGLLAEFTDRGNDPGFASKVLPAGTITKLNVPVSEVKKVSQPFESFGGRGAEIPSAFYTRISERLRHKDRAVTLWDYERLVLEAFPEIYRAKCLNHTQYEPNDSGTGIYRELSPGHVTIVTIPNKQFHNLRDPLRPFTSLGMLQDITAFISKRVSCFVKLHVRNPQFEEVRVKMKVRYHDGFDETFYTNLLQESIMRFLSPWAFTEVGNPSFGGKIYKSVLIDFIQEQPYVDYVTDVELFHDLPGKKGTSDKNEIEGSLAVSVLVSVPAIQHLITVINPSEESVSSEKCNCES